MAQRVHSPDDEAVATGAVDPAPPIAENRSLQDRLLRALADAENARRRTVRVAEEARQYTVSSFAREMLLVADNLQRAIADKGRSSSADGALLEGVQTTARLLMQAFGRFIRLVSRPGTMTDSSATRTRFASKMSRRDGKS